MKIVWALLWIFAANSVVFGFIYPAIDYEPGVVTSILTGIPIGIIAALLFRED